MKQNKKEIPLKKSELGSNNQLNSEQKLIKKLVLKGQNVCFTGSAGTGKSYLLRQLITLLQKKYGSNKVGITATTGTGADIIGGTTLASFLGLKNDSHLAPEIIYHRLMNSYSDYARKN
jgi:ABC-type transport system involved in cytochrome c biogenesis ATPase subunit